MAKRLTPFIGLAVMAALALAAFGVFSLSPAQATVEEPNARVAQPDGFQPQATALAAPALAIETVGTTTTARTDIIAGPSPAGNVRLAVGDSVTIDLRDSIVNTDAVADATDPVLNAYQLVAPDVVAADRIVNLDLVSTPADEASRQIHVDVATGENLNVRFATSTEVKITGAKAGAVTLQIVAIDYDTNVVAATDRVLSSVHTFSVVVVDNTFGLSGENPGSNTRQDVSFIAPADLVAGSGEITIELEDFGFPGSTVPSAVGISSDARYSSDDDTRIDAAASPALNTLARYNTDGSLASPTGYTGGQVAPNDVAISGEEITITVPDMNPENDRADDIKRGDWVTIVIRQGAGINNPTEGKGTRTLNDDGETVDSGGYLAKITTNEGTPELSTNSVFVPRRVKLDKDDGGRGTLVQAAGHGFKDGTTLTFFLDENSDGDKDAGDVELCSRTVGGNGSTSCNFTVSNPPFEPGAENYVGAVDGEGALANKAANNQHKDQRFELKGSISTSPKSGNPGETILVQGTDFPSGASVSSVTLAGDSLSPTPVATVTSTGDLSFRFIIPNSAEPGLKVLKVTVTGTAGDSDDDTKLEIGGPEVTSTPETVLPNQRISLVGTGFSPGSRITGGANTNADPVELDPSITIGGYEIPDALINDGDPVTVDNGGKWSASVDLPLRSVTTRDGEREIRISDSYGRSGTVSVTIPARSVTIDPPSGRIGTEATIRGENFPSKNDNGKSFNIQITYDPGGDRETQVSTVSDASGRFETKIRIPSGATIPSTNPVRVTFNDEQGTEVTTTVSHEVPEGSIILSSSSGLPGTTVTLRGEGFKAFVPVRSVKVGSIEVTPSPAPSTDALGQMTFDILIPGLDTGIQTIEVQVSDTTASIGFTVQSGTVTGAATPVAEGVADLGDNFVRAFNFDNDTKTWTFYDPMAGEASTMANFVAGNSYWILVGTTADAILNRETRTLTCVNDNCWNLVVW